jgi:hypothetical protein
LARVTWRYGNLPGLGVPGVEAVLLALSGEPTLSLMRFGAAVQPCPVITALSWRHNVKEQKLAVVELLNGISRSALVFQFSEDVRFIDEGEVAREDGAHLALEVLVWDQADPEDSVGPVCRCSLRGRIVPLEPIDEIGKDGFLPRDPPQPYKARPATIHESTLWAFVLTEESEKRAGFGTGELFVRLRGDFVLGASEDPRALDANFLRARLPTGDGREGGTFESWLWTIKT